MSAAILCSAKSYSIRNSQQPSVSEVATTLAEQELRLLGIRLPGGKSVPGAASASHSSASTGSSSSATSTPKAAAPAATACFGRALTDQPSRHVPGFGWVPALLTDCCNYLRSGGLLDTEGLFRVEGSRLRLRDLRQRLERGCGIRDGTPPQDVCSTLKAWLRELPEPLVPARMAHALAEAAGQSADRRIRVLRLCSPLLSADQLAALQFLCCFLGEVSRNSQRNRMDASNLATSLGPSLLPIRVDANVSTPREVARLNSGVALLLEFPNELGRWPVGLHHQHPQHQLHQTHLHQLHQLDSSDESFDDAQQRRRRRRSSGAIGGALKAVGRAVSRLASRSRSRSPGRCHPQQQQQQPPHRPPRSSPSPPAVRHFLHRLSAGSSSGPAIRRGVCAVAPTANHLPPLAPPRKHPAATATSGSYSRQPPPPPALPPLSTLPSVGALRTPLLMHQQTQHHQLHHLHRAATADSPTQCSTSTGPLRAVHSIPTTPLRVLQSPLA